MSGSDDFDSATDVDPDRETESWLGEQARLIAHEEGFGL
jgi:hypothetical protein